MIDLDQIVEDFSGRQEIKTVCQITIFFRNGDFLTFLTGKPSNLKTGFDFLDRNDILTKLKMGILK